MWLLFFFFFPPFNQPYFKQELTLRTMLCIIYDVKLEDLIIPSAYIYLWKFTFCILIIYKCNAYKKEHGILCISIAQKNC